MDNKTPIRKQLRLACYNYSKEGYYFITICTENNKCILRKGAHCSRENSNGFVLSEIGEVVDLGINNIEKHYSSIKVHKYVIMPNHIHMILILKNCGNGRALCIVQ
jgi:putative transposase